MEKLIVPKRYIPREGQTSVYIKQNHEYCIVRLHGEIYAVDNLCPHQGASLALGEIKEDKIVCPLHQYHFNIKDGTCNIERFHLKRYEVEVLDED